MRRADVLTKLLPPAPPGCPHRLGKWVTKTGKSTRVFPDGQTRPNRWRGGRLVVSRSGCIRTGGHDEHRTADGRTWR